MSTGKPNPTQAAHDRDMVLCAFMKACPEPTPAQVADWRKRHPQYADDIVAVAADMLAAHMIPQPEPPEPTAAELAEWDRADAAMAAAITGHAPGPSLADLIDAAGNDIPGLAEALAIDRDVLAMVEDGHVMLPVGKALVEALAKAMAKPAALIRDAISTSFWTPQVARAKADGMPTLRRVSYEQAIRESDMTPEQKAFWLAD